MNWLFKLAIFSFPVFIITLAIWFGVHREFQLTFKTENLRFEKQFQKEMGFKNDPWLKKQEEEVEHLWEGAGKDEFDLNKMEKELAEAIKEFDSEMKEKEKGVKEGSDRVTNARR